MSRTVYLLFAALAYLIFLATFLYLVAFVAGLPFAPYSVDAGGRLEAPLVAIVIDTLLILLFSCQHSIMARPAFKRIWTRIVPTPIERSMFVLLASAALILLFVGWRPLPDLVWSISNPILMAGLWILFALGRAIVLLSTFLINHFELFGLQQVWLHMRDRHAAAPELRQPFLYKLVRHPLYTGFFIAFWATPRMTQGHLLFAAGMSLYMLIAIEFEERDLLRIFGGEYEDYRSRVGKLAPRFWGGR